MNQFDRNAGMAPAAGDALVCVSVINAIPRPAPSLRKPAFRVVMALPLAVLGAGLAPNTGQGRAVRQAPTLGG